MLWHAYALLCHGANRIGFYPGSLPGRPRLRRSPDELLRVLERADEAVWITTALSVCAETGLLRELACSSTIEDLSRHLSLPPALVRSLVEVLIGLGLTTWDGRHVRPAPALLPFTSEEGAKTFRDALRAPLLQTADFRRRIMSGTLSLEGWTHTDGAIIEAQGALTRLWATKALPKLRFLPGLLARLNAPDAALLDVGAGAAGLSITLCRAFPNLRAVALEPAPQPAAVGERQVSEAELGERILVRRQRVEHLEDHDAFDLAFLPQMFLPDDIMDEATRRVFLALRPGGWLLVAVLAQKGYDLPSSIRRLKNLLWGANSREADVIRPSLTKAGFDPVIQAPASGPIRMICARRPNVKGRLELDPALPRTIRGESGAIEEASRPESA
jgi:hypothetical protein